MNDQLITALRKDIAESDAELRQSQETNELILLVVSGLLILLIATVFVMIICSLRQKKRQEIELA